MVMRKGSGRGSQEDTRKKEEGCVLDPEEEKAAEFSSPQGCEGQKYQGILSPGFWAKKAALSLSFYMGI